MPTMTPRILIVAAGKPLSTPIDPAKEDYRRPLIAYTKAALAAKGYTPSPDYALAPVGPGTSTNNLETEIAKHLNPKPDIILTVASAATKAAKRVVRANPSAKGIPIVFTVVSRPDTESTDPNNPNPDPVDPICLPPPRAERITGVSRKLVDTARGAVERFAACLNNNCSIHWCCRLGLHQANEAEKLIQAPPPLPGVVCRPHHMPATDCNPFLQIISTQIPPNPGPGGALNGLFLIPDDLVGGCADDMISTAQHPSRRVPAFVQQLEYVCPEFNPPPPPGTPVRPCAMGGYGVKPQWVGDNAADSIDEILQQGADHAKDMAVKYPTEADLRFVINMAVVNQLAIGITVPSGAQKCSQHAGLKTAKVKAVTATAKKTPKRKPAAKPKAARKPKAKKRPARASRKTATRTRGKARRRR